MRWRSGVSRRVSVNTIYILHMTTYLKVTYRREHLSRRAVSRRLDATLARRCISIVSGARRQRS